MNIKTLNKNQWYDPNNWARKGLFGIYFSKTDTRIWVPKATPVFGWTLNFGHRHSVLWLLSIIGIALLTAMAGVLISTVK